MRLDAALVERGLARSRAVARDAVESGRVRVDGVVVRKPSREVGVVEQLEVEGAPRYVGRGGDKLEAALARFAVDPQGWRCLDVGASTGGFTDCLLQQGAARVVAVEVGHGQLAEGLRADPRVESHEGVNIRETPPAPWSGTFQLAVVDVSFVSLLLVLPHVLPWVEEGGWLVALVKPQFEAGRGAVGKGGIVRDPAARAAAVEKVRAWMEAQPGWRVEGWMDSPLKGGDGNQEVLLAARRDGGFPSGAAHAQG